MMLAVLLAITCGSERWSVKTAKDAAATQIDSTAQTAAIQDLRNRTAPAWSESLPRQAEEKQTLTIVAYLDGFKKEGDSDYHVGIRDDQGKTMVVEFPAPGCLNGSHLKAKAKAARTALEGILHVPITGSYKKMKQNTVQLRVTGVFFWDKKHGVPGARAPNGAELHPVVKIEWLQ
jgi:hypothetical protein